MIWWAACRMRATSIRKGRLYSTVDPVRAVVLKELEAMSADLGPIQDGFDDGFAYGTISLTSGTSVELVDQVAEHVQRRVGKPCMPAH